MTEFELFADKVSKQHKKVVTLIESGKLDEYLIEKRKHNRMMDQLNTLFKKVMLESI